MPGWEPLVENISPPERDDVAVTFVVDGLQVDTYYAFVVRAKNALGFGPPSLPSEFVRTSCKFFNCLVTFII